MRKLGNLIVLLALLVVALQLPASSAQAQAGLPVAYVLCDQYLRSLPDDLSAPLALLRPGEPTLLITGRSQDGYWLVAMRQNGQIGWLADTTCIEVDGDKNAAPWTAPAPYTGPQIATLSCEQYIFSAPRDDAARLVHILDPDILGAMEVLGRDATETWLLIQSQDDSIMGWLYYGECVYLYGDTVNLPLSDVEMPAPGAPVESTVGAPPTATIACPQFVRSAPNNDSARLLVLQPSDGTLAVLARDQAAVWLLVQRSDGAMGWVVDTNCIRVQGDVFSVPNRIDIVMPIPGQETSTPAPTPISGTPLPTATPVPSLTPTPSEPLPFPGAVPGGQGIPAAGPTATPAPANTLLIQLCGSTSTPVTVQTGGRSLRALLPLTVVGMEEMQAWYRDDAVYLWVDAAQWPVTSSNEIPPAVADLGANWWAGGYSFDLGALSPGLHYVYVQMNLSRQHQTIDRVYPAGEYRYDCAVTIQ